MKKFKFRLQTVLEYREKIAEQLKGELLKANHALAEAETELQRLETLFMENLLEIQGVRPLADLLLNAQNSESLNVKMEQTKELIEQRKKDVEEAMEAYQHASKELKAVNVLKERKLQEYHQKLAEYESSSLDELAVQRAARKQDSVDL